MDTEENCCEHGDHLAPKGLRFCCKECQDCEDGLKLCSVCEKEAKMEDAETAAQNLFYSQIAKHRFMDPKQFSRKDSLEFLEALYSLVESSIEALTEEIEG